MDIDFLVRHQIVRHVVRTGVFEYIYFVALKSFPGYGWDGMSSSSICVEILKRYAVEVPDGERKT